MFKEAASLVANRGYTNVKTYSGGIPAWVKAGYKLDTSRALPMVDNKLIGVEEFRRLFSKVSVVDIRTPAMYRLGHLSMHMRDEVEQTSIAHRKKYHRKIPLAKLSMDYAKIPKDLKIIIIDHNGKRSKLAGNFLMNHGFRDVVCLKGGLETLKSN